MATTVLGLMSGTSADGVDGVLVKFWGNNQRPSWRLLSSAHHPYPVDLQQRIVAAGQGNPCQLLLGCNLSKKSPKPKLFAPAPLTQKTASSWWAAMAKPSGISHPIYNCLAVVGKALMPQH